MDLHSLLNRAREIDQAFGVLRGRGRLLCPFRVAAGTKGRKTRYKTVCCSTPVNERRSFKVSTLPAPRYSGDDHDHLLAARPEVKQQARENPFITRCPMAAPPSCPCNSGTNSESWIPALAGIHLDAYAVQELIRSTGWQAEIPLMRKLLAHIDLPI